MILSDTEMTVDIPEISRECACLCVCVKKYFYKLKGML